MVYLYYAKAKTEHEEIKPEYIVKDVSVCKKNSVYLNRIDYVWHLITLGKYKKIVVLNKDNRVVHTSCVVGKCFKFPFLSKSSAEIGPCATHSDFRGMGIYPMVLNYIRSIGEYTDYYMLVRSDNTASIRGIEKAGFLRIGTVEKRRGRWIRTL